MSVLIRGMEMPESCSVCPCNYDNVCAVDYKYPTFNEWRSKRPDWCPLVELPAEHGRLIDADALTVSNGWVAEAENYRTHITFIYEYDIVNAPTIIEAEGVDG